MTGISITELKNGKNQATVRWITMGHTLSFIVGFSTIFFVLGATAGFIGELFVDYRDLIRQLSAIFILVMGLYLLGIFQPKWLMKERKIRFSLQSAGYVGSFFIGIGFAAGWSPCVGPILSAILALSVAQPSAWLSMTTWYSLGFALPFFILSFSIGSSKWLLRYSTPMMRIGGVVMVIIAILLYTGQLTQITNGLNAITPAWLKF